MNFFDPHNFFGLQTDDFEGVRLQEIENIFTDRFAKKYLQKPKLGLRIIRSMTPKTISLEVWVVPQVAMVNWVPSDPLTQL